MDFVLNEEYKDVKNNEILIFKEVHIKGSKGDKEYVFLNKDDNTKLVFLNEKGIKERIHIY